MWQTLQWVFLAFLGSMLATDLLSAGDQAAPRESRKVVVGDGVELHYVECGAGVPIVFIHGGLEDYSLWEEQVRAFGETYRAIAYSRATSPRL
ncbi:MAG: alpha/beta fold hydrolase [Thermoguttaceae bacterium]|jgi:non-heme chloroperoxidase